MFRRFDIRVSYTMKYDLRVCEDFTYSLHYSVGRDHTSSSKSHTRHSSKKSVIHDTAHRLKKVTDQRRSSVKKKYVQEMTSNKQNTQGGLLRTYARDLDRKSQSTRSGGSRSFFLRCHLRRNDMTVQACDWGNPVHKCRSQC